MGNQSTLLDYPTIHDSPANSLIQFSREICCLHNKRKPGNIKERCVYDSFRIKRKLIWREL